MKLSQFKFCRQEVPAEISRAERSTFCVILHIAVCMEVDPLIETEHLYLIPEYLETLLPLYAVRRKEQGEWLS